MNKQQRLRRQPPPPVRVRLLLVLLQFWLCVLSLKARPAGASVLGTLNCSGFTSSCSEGTKPSVVAFGGLLPPPRILTNRSATTTSGDMKSSSILFSRGRFRLHPRLRVRHLSRDSGSSHLLELSRQRLLLEREGDLEKYLNLPLLPFPAEEEVHSQRKRSRTPPPGSPLPGPLLQYRKAKQLLMGHSGTSNSRRVLMMRDRLSLLVHHQQELLYDSPQSSVEVLRTLWDIQADGPPTLQQQELKEEKLQQHQLLRRYERENSLLQERRTRPLGSRFLFICGIDLRMTGTDLENIFQTITEHQVYARLKRNSEGRHLGFGLIQFGSTLDATRCLLQLNGIKVGNSTISLGEAFGRAEEPGQSFDQQLQHQQPQHQERKHRQGGSRPTRQRKRAKYIHPYPLPCE